LSGGLDSSILTKIASEYTELNQVYNLRIRREDIKLDDQIDDYYYAQKVASDLEIEMITIDADESFLDNLELMVDILEDGIADPAALSMLELCKQISKDKFKVVLLGQGPDEFMMGYRRHVAWKMLSNKVIRITLILCSPVLTLLKGKSAFLRRLGILSKLSLLDETDRFRRLFYWTDPQVLRRIFSLKEDYYNETLESIISDRKPHEELNLEKADRSLDLLSLNLHYSDRICMKFGLEGRVPYLDNQMIEAYSKLKHDQKLSGFRSKNLLKDVGEQHLGKDIVNRKKTGFSLPIRAWFQRDNSLIAKYLNREILEAHNIFDADYVLSLLKATRLGLRDDSYTLWVILVQLIWLDKNKDYRIQ
jgi:asparagine synthase (glutamine-hydrolysing)